MTKPIHVTSITSFLQCPNKFKNGESDATIDKTYPGDLLNIEVLSNGPTDAYFNWYMKEFPMDFKKFTMMKRAYAEAREYVEDLKKKFYVYQECKHYLKWKDYFIVGSMDLLLTTKEGEFKVTVEDLKFSTHDYYLKEERTREDAQSFVYPLMAMEFHKVDVCEFSFVVWDKNKGTMAKNTIVRTKAECQEWLDKAMSSYMECEVLDIWPEKKNTFCFTKNAAGEFSCPFFNQCQARRCS